MCRILTWLFGLLYILALVLLLIGTFGMLGSEPDPLAGVYLVPIGLPWILLVDQMPEPLWPWLAAMARCIRPSRFGFALLEHSQLFSQEEILGSECALRT